METIAFEIDDGIDDVFEDTGASDRAFFGDVSDHDYGDIADFGELHETGGTFADLGDAACAGGDGGEVDGLDRVDDQSLGLEAFDVFDGQFEIGFAEQIDFFVADTKAFCAHLDLVDAFFA